MRLVIRHVARKRDEPRVVFVNCSRFARHHRLATKDALTKHQHFFATGLHVVLDQPVESEHALGWHHRIHVSIWQARTLLIDHAELGDGVAQIALMNCTSFQVEPPAIRARLHRMQVEKAEHLGLNCRIACHAGRRVIFEVSVYNDVIAFFPRVDPVQHERRATFEPSDVTRCSITRNNADTHRHVSVIAGGVDAALDEIGVPKERAVVQHRIVRGECHVVR